MKNIVEMRQRLAELVDEMQRLIDGPLTDSDRAKFDQLERQAKSIQSDIERAENLGQRSAFISAPAPKPTITSIGGGLERHDKVVETMTTAPDWRSMFGPPRDEFCSDFRTFKDFVSAVRSGRHDPRLEVRAMSGSIPADGGFALGTQFEQFFLDDALANEVVRTLPGIRIVPMKTRTAKIPAFDAHDHSATSPAGVVGYWADEGSSVTESDLQLRQCELEARRLTILTRLSLELAEDAVSFEGELARALSEGLGDYLDRGFLRGSGASGEPLGIINSPCAITVSKETGQAAASLTTENVSKMWSRMWAPGRRRCVWLANSDIVPELFGLNLTTGTSGTPVFLPAGGFSAAPYGTIFGRPLFYSEHLSTLGTVGDLVLFDPGAYAIGIVGNSMRLQFSDHRYFESAQRLWRAYIRVAGQCLLDEAITPAQGSTTVSPIVMLESR